MKKKSANRIKSTSGASKGDAPVPSTRSPCNSDSSSERTASPVRAKTSPSGSVSKRQKTSKDASAAKVTVKTSKQPPTAKPQVKPSTSKASNKKVAPPNDPVKAKVSRLTKEAVLLSKMNVAAAAKPPRVVSRSSEKRKKSLHDKSAAECSVAIVEYSSSYTSAEPFKKAKKRADQIFSNEEQKPSKKMKTSNSGKEVQKGKMKVIQGNEDRLPTVRVRTSPNALFELIPRLKEPQKQAIRDMGFGSFLDLKIDILPGTLVYFVVDKLDIGSLSLNTESGPIKFNCKSVHDMLGIPMGDVDLMSLPVREVKKGESSFSDRWKSLYGGKYGRPAHVAYEMEHNPDSGFSFKVNFLMMFVATMIHLDKTGAYTAPFLRAVIDRIAEDTDIRSINWCAFLLDHMKGCKDVWPPKTKGFYFAGPATFLVLLYLDSTFCEKFPVARSRPAISYWNRIFISQRVEAELEANGEYGRLPLQLPFSEDAEEGFTAPESACEPIGSSSQTSKEDYISNIKGLITQLDSTLEKAVSLFPDDLKLSSVNEKFRKFLLELNGDDGDHDKDGGDKGAGDKDGAHDKDGGDKDVVDKDGGEYVEPVIPSVLQEETQRIEQVKAAVSEEAQPTEHPKNDGGLIDPPKDVSAAPGVSGIVEEMCSVVVETEEGVDVGVSSDHPKNDVSTPGVSANAGVIFEGDDWWNDPEFIEEYCETQDRNTVKVVPFPSLSPKCAKSDCGKGPMNEASENAQADSDVISAKNCFYSPARLKKPSKYFVSPYRRRETSISTGISQLEWDVSGSVFIMQNDPSEVLFETEQGELLTRSICESLAPMIWVDADLINVWSSILNRDQTADGSFFSRLFMTTTTITSNMWNGLLRFEDAFRIFNKNMHTSLKANNLHLHMDHVETVFFPIVAHDHYYLLVFNLCKPAFNIIDNSAACNDYESKYKQVCDVVRRLFVEFLKDKRQDIASAIEKAKPCVFKMKWRTLNNHDDCGVFLMCHMDTYLGQSQRAWKLDFKTENEKGKDCQRAQLTRLRAKYMSKILLHESNKHRKKIIDYAKSFNEKYGLDDGKEKVQNAVALRLQVVRM